jgi:hypothetical protein
MLDVLLESPILVAICGLIIAAIVLFVWMQTGHRAALLGAVSTVGLTAVLVLISLQVETDREQIITTINDVADAVRENNAERVYSFVHPGARESLRRARPELENYHFSDARMTRLKSISVNRESAESTAIAEFNVVVAIDHQGSTIRVPRFVRAYFTQQSDRWLVFDFEHFEPTQGLRE